MLSELSGYKPNMKMNFGQRLVTDNEKVKKLFGKNIKEKNKTIKIISCAYSHDHSRQFVLYKRHNSCGREEAGVAYIPGPDCKAPQDFPREMLRLFSDNEKNCYELAETYYIDLSEAKVFRPRS